MKRTKKNPTFYVIDDDAGSIAIANKILKGAGFHVFSSTSSQHAESDVIDKKPDCILLDLMMPELDGFELLRRLRSRKDLVDTKIVIISGKDFEFDRRQAREMGADGYIVKPLSGATHLPILKRILADTVEVKFWGIRGTLPVPGTKTVRYGGNTSCVTLSFPEEQFFIFDAGTGIKVLSDYLEEKQVNRVSAKIFISHPHWDHINALPFFAPLYVQGNEIEIIGSSHGDLTMRELISAQMEGAYFPITIREFSARVYFRNITEGSYEIDGVKLETILLNHPGNCLGYRVFYKGRSICYVTDNELFLKNLSAQNNHFVQKLNHFTQQADVLIADTTFIDEEYEKKNRLGTFICLPGNGVCGKGRGKKTVSVSPQSRPER